MRSDFSSNFWEIRPCQRWLRRCYASLTYGFLTSVAVAGTFGTVIPIPGHINDLAVDERRGVVYLANYTGNRIDVVSVEKKALANSLNVAAQPSSVALSPDGRHLVITHYGNFAPPATPSNTLTVLALEENQRQTFTLGSPPLGVAFGADNMAFVVTTRDFLLLEPETGVVQLLETVSGLTAKTLPVPAATPLLEIIRASIAPSGDGLWICGIAEAGTANQTLMFRYDVAGRHVVAERWISTPVLGPRVMSVNREGTILATGWGLFYANGILMAQFRNAIGTLSLGSLALDSRRGVVYAQVAQGAADSGPAAPKNGAPRAAAKEPGVLMIADGYNLAIRERLKLPENLTGRSVLSSDGEVMYSVSESGLTVLPVGALSRHPRVIAGQEDVVFRGSFCDRRVMAQEFDVVDPGGGSTDFSLAPSIGGVSVSPSSGVTPARVQVSVDPNVFQNQKGTTTGWIEIRSSAAVNLPPAVRVLINNREPDQRGTFYNVPGKLVDILADPGRNRFYILRQDKNQVLIFDGASSRHIGTLSTGNTPTQMAMTFDRQYLLVANDDSQIVYVYNLDTLEFQQPIVFPSGHYPRSIAASGRAILAACRVAGPKHTIDRIDLPARTAVGLPTLGIYENTIDADTALAATPSGASVLVAEANGTLMLYDANADTFVVSRKDFEKLSGAIAALSDDRFVLDNNLLNGTLMPLQKLETGTGSSSGFALVDGMGLRTTAPSASSPGVIQRVDLNQPGAIRSTRMTEAPLLSETGRIGGFVRTLAPLPGSNVIVSLTTSGFTVLPWRYDAAVTEPRIESVVSAADGSAAVAPGGLITITGSDLSPVNAATSEIPMPTVLANSCLTVNGVLMPITLVSPAQINGQLPFTVTGAATMILRTPGGVSNSFRFSIQATAPSVFRTQITRDEEVPMVVRALNNEVVTLSNPIHLEDTIIIYATGLGLTTPAVEAGAAAPESPPAEAVVAPEVSLGEVRLPIVYAGLAPGQVGVYQIVALVPDRVPLGMDIPLTITQGGYTTSLSVRVVK